MKYSRILAPSALVLLTACGGSNQSIESALQDYEAISDSVDAAMLFEDDLTGSASYAGILVVGEQTSANDQPATYIAFGDANVSVDFDAGTATGSADNFYEIDLATLDADNEDQDISEIGGTAIDGTFELTNSGQAMSGTLNHVDGEVATYDLGIDNVEYRGATGQYLLVDATGTSTAADRDDLDAFGSFVGENTGN